MNAPTAPALRVLIVDDEQEVRDSLRRHLEDHDYEVQTAADGREGLAAFRQRRPDAMLVDLRMPELDGLEVLAAVQQEAPELPIVMVSGTGMIGDVVEALRLGAWDYILKPITDFSILRHALTRALERARLIVDNRQHRERLEQLVEERTRALQQALHRQQLLFLTMNQAVVFFDAQGRVAEWNPAAERILGRPAEQLKGLPSTALFPEAVDEKGSPCPPADLPVARSLRTGQSISGVALGFTPGGDRQRRWVWINTIPQFPAGREGPCELYATFEDITRQKQMEAELREAQKLEAIGQLAGGVAHDFNNILAAMLMNLDLLYRRPQLDEEAREGLRELAEGAHRASSLTRQLLMFSRRSVLEVKPLDLNEVVAHLLKMLGRILGEQHRLRFVPQPTLPLVEADASMLEQVLVNLAVNARDAMPKGGQIAIATATVEETEATARPHPGWRPGCFVRLSVADNGCGMDESTLKRIFEPFFTTKEVGRGTGLGLATVHGIVAQHQGWVEVASQVGQGSTFQVFLPVCQNAAPLAAPLTAAAPTPATGRETLLVVEDDPMVRKTLTQALGQLGYRVLCAETGQEAMSRWQQNAAQVDLLFTDMVMPEGMTGLELAALLRAQKPRLKVIVSSGYTTEIRPAQAAANGIVYLPKPYEVSVLAQTVRACLDDSTPAPPSRRFGLPTDGQR